MSEVYPKGDLAVVGLGPAGITCAVQARREGLHVTGFDPGTPGGLVGAAYRVDNLPSTPEGIQGEILARRLGRALKQHAVERLPWRVVAVEGPFEATPRTRWIVRVDQPMPNALGFRALAVATGTAPRPLPPELAGCVAAARDVRELPTRLQDARVAIVGGGDAAFDAALRCAHQGARVDLLIRGARGRAVRPLEEAVGLERGIRVHVGWVLARALRQGARGAWSLQAMGGGEAIRAEHLLVLVGRDPVLDLVARFRDAEGQLTANPASGLYLAGDLLRERDRFVTLAMADGMRAARAAARFVRADKRAGQEHDRRGEEAR